MTKAPAPTGWQFGLFLYLHMGGLAIGWLIWGADLHGRERDLWTNIALAAFWAGNWIACTNLMSRAYPKGGDKPYFGGPFMWFITSYRLMVFHALPALERATGMPFFAWHLGLLAVFVLWMAGANFRELQEGEKRQPAE